MKKKNRKEPKFYSDGQWNGADAKPLYLTYCVLYSMYDEKNHMSSLEKL